MHKTAQTYIAEFRRGESFNASDSVAGVVVNKRLDRSALGLLTKELATGTPEVRENIVRLLEQAGLQLDTPAADKFAIIRDHAIIRALLVEGFAKDDAGADAAAAILRERCKPSDLAAFNEIYVSSLQRAKGDYLYLAAKAKATRALPYVDTMAKSPAWRADPAYLEPVKIAQAALGNNAVEDGYIQATLDAEKKAPPAPKNRFYDVGAARDGTELAERLRDLGWIGTRRSLQLVCRYLRSPLKSYVPEVSERSVRYAALDALQYNFPDERVLSDPISGAEWTAVEQFCTKHLGAVFDGPTPKIPPDQAYPTNVLPRPIGM